MGMNSKFSLLFLFTVFENESLVSFFFDSLKAEGFSKNCCAVVLGEKRVNIVKNKHVTWVSMASDSQVSYYDYMTNRYVQSLQLYLVL